jgi:hypothetical protein
VKKKSRQILSLYEVYEKAGYFFIKAAEHLTNRRKYAMIHRKIQRDRRDDFGAALPHMRGQTDTARPGIDLPTAA